MFLANPAQLLGWVTDPNVDERLVLQVVPGPASDRTPLLGGLMGAASEASLRGLAICAREWVPRGVVPALYDLLERAKMPPTTWRQPPSSNVPWEILWALIGIDGFAVEEPLRGMVDQGFYLVHDAHRLIWEARWIAREDPNLITDFVALLLRWFKGEVLSASDQSVLSGLKIKRQVTTDAQRLDLVNLLFVLARQNGILDRVIIAFDGVEDVLRADKRSVLKQFFEFVESVRRWVPIGGTPIGIVIGFSSTSEDRAVLRKYQPKLAAEVEAGLHWCRRLLS